MKKGSKKAISVKCMKPVSQTFIMTALAALLLFFTAACQSSVDWVGTYTFTNDLGEDPGGAAISMEYQLKLNSDHCEVAISGYQADTLIRCVSERSDETAVIRFYSYSNGEVKNIYGVEVYKVGEPLFTLRQSESTPKALLTEWGALMPDGIENRVGSYFVKQ